MTEAQEKQVRGLLATDMPLAEVAQAAGLSYNTFRLRVATSHKRIIRILVDDDADVEALYESLDASRKRRSQRSPASS